MKIVGSKCEVFHGTANHTPGGLTRKDLTKSGTRIVSKKQQKHIKKSMRFLMPSGLQNYPKITPK